MSDIEETPLPGIGTRRSFAVESGVRIGVVAHRGGEDRELLIYDRDDPDSCRATVRLTGKEAAALADLLQAGPAGGAG